MEEDSFEGLVQAVVDAGKDSKRTEATRKLLCDTYVALPAYEPIEEVEARVFSYQHRK